LVGVGGGVAVDPRHEQLADLLLQRHAGDQGTHAAARQVLDEAARLDPPLRLDYLALVDPADFTEIGDDFTGEAVLAVAARVGSTRLIDNIPLTFGAAS
ncbi:pantoate--beta-alanine ligase, partial [Streptomyces rubradiris]|uniref:pantoate--beta-alanine ligase n=1 Tax=Streptomyces rubradiris TaxID=285531 RepID=UPI003317521C